MATTVTDYLATHGRKDEPYPVIDLDTADQQRHTLIISFAGGTKKALVQFIGLAAGEVNEHLCLDVHAFVDDRQARAAVVGLEHGARYPGFDQTAPGHSHGQPAVRLVTVLIGAQDDDPDTESAATAPNGTTAGGDTPTPGDTAAHD